MPNNKTLKLKVTSEDNGLRADVFLAKTATCYSRSQISRLLKSGAIVYNNKKIKPSLIVLEGQEFILPAFQATTNSVIAEPNIKLNIIYEDAEILLVNKPAGLIVHPGAGNYEESLAGGLLAYKPSLGQVGEQSRPGIVHRLDKETSGLMVVAKTEESRVCLVKKFKNHEIKKRYLGFCCGKLEFKKGVLKKPIGRHPKQRHKMAVSVLGAKKALSYYRELKYFPKYNISLLLLEIVTGRTHQIRVHLADIGNPILGDLVYGANFNKRISMENKKNNIDLALKRQMLHARRLSFLGNKFGNKIENNIENNIEKEEPEVLEKHFFWAPWPLDFKNLFNFLLK